MVVWSTVLAADLQVISYSHCTLYHMEANFKFLHPALRRFFPESNVSCTSCIIFKFRNE
jgi:hypothetical protein